MKKLIVAVLLSMSVVGVRAQEMGYDPIKAQIGYQTAGCMRDWITGSLNRGERDRLELLVGAIRMCGGIATKFGWTKEELVYLAYLQLRSVPGIYPK